MGLSAYAQGVVFIGLVATIWTAASYLVVYIYEDLKFSEPFVLTYVANSLFALYIPLWIVLVKAQVVINPPMRTPTTAGPGAGRPHQQRPKDGSPEADLLLDPHDRRGVLDCLYGTDTAQRLSDASGSGDDGSSNNRDSGVSHANVGVDGVPAPEASAAAETRMSHWETAKVALIMCPLWFLANYSYNASLSLTSVSSSTVISATSSLFTFFFSVFIRVEKFEWIKVLGVAFLMGGTSMVAVQDDAGTSTFFGDLVALFSAMMYGVYTTTLRRYVTSDDAVAMPLLFGYLGWFNAAMLAPILLLLLITGVIVPRHFSGAVFGFLVLKGLFDNVLSDYLWARAVVLTSPTVATVGLGLTIPFAFLVDFLLGRSTATALSGFGALCVIIGFVLVNVGGDQVCLRHLFAWGCPVPEPASGEALLGNGGHPADGDDHSSNNNSNSNSETLEPEGRDGTNSGPSASVPAAVVTPV